MAMRRTRTLESTSISNLSSFLLGGFELTRHIDCADGTRLRLHGTAEFRAGDASGLAYSECGVLVSGDASYEVSRSYRYRLVSAQSAEVYLASGAYFHSLDLSRGRCTALHRCGDDIYRGEYIAEGRDLVIRWRCKGPTKDYAATSRLERLPTRSDADR